MISAGCGKITETHFKNAEVVIGTSDTLGIAGLLPCLQGILVVAPGILVVPHVAFDISEQIGCSGLFGHSGGFERLLVGTHTEFCRQSGQVRVSELSLWVIIITARGMEPRAAGVVYLTGANLAVKCRRKGGSQVILRPFAFLRSA